MAKTMAEESASQAKTKFVVEGDYFEACSCKVMCSCIFLAPATEDHCDVFIGWHVTNGRMGNVDLKGLNAALVVHSPKQMTDGGWKLALYTDERATKEQSEALAGVFSGGAGGHLANLGPLVGSVAGVTSAPITFEKRDGKRRLQVGRYLQGEIEELKGGDGKNPAIITNAPFGALTQPVRKGKAGIIRYDHFWKAEVDGTNAFLSEFRYEN
jgi:hypothetical protein